MFDFDTPNAWISKDQVSMNIVKNTMNKNNILFTRYSYMKKGGLFKINPLKKGIGQVPLKQNSPLNDIEKYGGYDKASSSYFSFVKCEDKKGKEIRRLVPIDTYLLEKYEDNPEKYLSDVIGLKNPIVLIKCVKYNSCLEMDGFRMQISSKSGKKIFYKPAVQLVVGTEKEIYIKKIVKLLSKSENIEITEFDEITAAQNIEIYDLLKEKFITTVFKVKFSKLGAKLELHRSEFVNLDLRKQCFVINEVLKIIHNNVMSGDLRFIGEAQKSGMMTSNSVLSDITDINTIKLINQSITGLYEIEIDLLKM